MTVARRVLGRTALSIAEIGFGCGPTAQLIAAGERDAQRKAVSRALELGIDYFDTAPRYGAGRSERTLGALLRELGAAPRIATKVELGYADLGNVRDAILRSVEGSLARLAVPRISVLHLHNRIGMARAPQGDIGSGALLGLEEVLGPGGVVETFDSLRRSGVVDYFGCSAYGGDMRAVEQVVQSESFDCLQVHYSLLNPSAWVPMPTGANVRDYACIAAHAAAAGMGVIALRVLEAGALAGRSAQDGSAPPPLLPSESMVHTALRFALSRPQVTSVLVGFSDVVQVEDAVLAAAKGPLPPELLARIDGGRIGAP